MKGQVGRVASGLLCYCSFLLFYGTSSVNLVTPSKEGTYMNFPPALAPVSELMFEGWDFAEL